MVLIHLQEMREVGRMKFMSPYWDNKAKLELLAKWILVHSYMYYELDRPYVSDEMFDNNCKQFVALAKEDKQSFKRHNYCYAMHDFDGSTGFDLFSRLNEVDRGKVLMSAEWILQNLVNKKKK